MLLNDNIRFVCRQNARFDMCSAHCAHSKDSDVNVYITYTIHMHACATYIVRRAPH